MHFLHGDKMHFGADLFGNFVEIAHIIRGNEDRLDAVALCRERFFFESADG